MECTVYKGYGIFIVLNMSPPAPSRLCRFLRWVADVRDHVQSRWPYLDLLPNQGGVPPCRVLGGINTIVALVVRVPLSDEGRDGNPEDALSYDVGIYH